MTKKMVVVGGGAGIAAAVARAMSRDPETMITIVETGEKTDSFVYDEATKTIGYDPKMVESLMGSLTESELYGITLHEAHRLVLEGRLGEYKIPNAPVKDVKIDVSDDLPKNAKKPKFLLEQNHSIRSFRR